MKRKAILSIALSVAILMTAVAPAIACHPWRQEGKVEKANDEITILKNSPMIERLITQYDVKPVFDKSFVTEGKPALVVTPLAMGVLISFIKGNQVSDAGILSAKPISNGFLFNLQREEGVTDIAYSDGEIAYSGETFPPINWSCLIKCTLSHPLFWVGFVIGVVIPAFIPDLMPLDGLIEIPLMIMGALISSRAIAICVPQCVE
ncbi:MAG: hypothetical protein U9O96_04625 [Candidatus Thermoplasmatota archaeon]|nr:hypothetical protein [Candidatus Thermoplasmatota archaeon]